jgi:Transposase DDE domain
MERVIGKSIRRISNWKEYNRTLVNRGSLTVWIDEGAIKNWLPHSHRGGRGRDFKFSNFAIETALMLKVFFRLPLRSLEGFINSLFQLIKVTLCSPDYSRVVSHND